MENGSNLDVLLIEDNPGDARLVVEALAANRSAGFRVHHVDCLTRASERLALDVFDAIIVDLNLPDAHHLQALKHLVSLAPDVPILVLSGNENEDLAIMAVQNGAQDYLVKGIESSDKLSRSIFYACERKRQRNELAHLARIDALTGLPNRMQFDESLPKTLNRMQRSGGTCALLYLDLDNFKPVNDSMGHQVGDNLLRGVAQRLSTCLRRGDTVCRIGGDEFALILEGVSGTQGASAAANKVCDALAAPIDLGGTSVSISASIGIAIYPKDADTPEALLQKADDAMYMAKREGLKFALSSAVEPFAERRLPPERLRAI